MIAAFAELASSLGSCKKCRRLKIASGSPNNRAAIVNLAPATRRPFFQSGMSSSNAANAKQSPANAMRARADQPTPAAKLVP